MSGFDLNQQEIDNRTARMPARTGLEPGAFDNFLAGTGKVTMQTLAKAGSAIDLLGAVGPIVQDKFTGGTEAQDRYFQEHEEVFGKAVDYWTPKPNEVGAAGQVVGQLLGTLPLVFASPGLAVGATQVSTAEDLTKKGVDPLKAQAVGAVQAAGLGLGIWVPILGKTLAQRVLLGGAGFNAVQGVATRGASGVILEGTPGAEDFKAFDPTSLTLDVLLGAAFGGIAHVSPAMRAEGAAWQSKLADWGAKLKPSEVDALITMRQAQHINADSMPGKPVDMADADAHVQRLRQAIDDLANDRPVNVEQLPPARYEIDPTRQAEAEAEAAKVQSDVAEVLRAEGALVAVKSEINIENRHDESGYPLPEFEVPVPDNVKRNMIDAYNREAESSETKLGRIEDSSDISAKTAAFRIMAESEGYKVGGDRKYLTLTKDNGVILKVRLSDHPNVNKGVHFGENIINIAPGDGSKPVDTFASALFILRNAAVDENGDTVFLQHGHLAKVGADATAATPDQSSAVVKESLTPEPVAAPAARAADQAGDLDAKPLDPLASEAQRFAAENPDIPVVIGKTADGEDITTTPRQMMEESGLAVEQAHADATLFEVAASCLLGAK